MECPSCHTAMRDGAKFCGKCGTALPRGCSACGHINPSDDRFCSECGASLARVGMQATSPEIINSTPSTASEPRRTHEPALAERRQITVLFCDMVGSSALSTQLDPEEHRDVVSAFQTCCAGAIERLDGMVAQYLGDGVLAYFGYPAAHEDDAERAIRAGLALIDALPALRPAPQVVLRARIGIATGVVVVGDLIRGGVTQENAAIGETTNLAARLQALAKPDTLLIAPQTHQLVGGMFQYRDLGPHTLKGFGTPVRVHQVLKTSALENRFEARHGAGSSPLLGREEELDFWCVAGNWPSAAKAESFSCRARPVSVNPV